MPWTMASATTHSLGGVLKDILQQAAAEEWLWMAAGYLSDPALCLSRSGLKM